MDMEVDLEDNHDTSADCLLTEEFLLNHTGEQRLCNIRHLSLEHIGLKALNEKLFNKMLVLERLNLARNELTWIPEKLNLNLLRCLDVSENKLSSLEFVQQFPSLKELYVEKNDVEMLDKCIAMTLCVSLEFIDKTKRATLMRIVESVCEKLQPNVKKVWENHFAEKYAKRIPEHSLHRITRELTELTHSITKDLVPRNMARLQQFLLQRTCQEHVHQVQTGLYNSPIKKHCLSPEKPNNIKKDTQLKISPVQSPYKFSRLKETSLPHIADYDPVHFVRCHFGDREALKHGKTHNDPTDEYTKVWWCAFEPSPEDKSKTTNVVATCGGEMVCLLDCVTGRILKRYRCPKEQFYVVAWTTLQVKRDGREWPANILAVAGFNAHIKLLYPEQLVCFDSWGDGRPNRACTQYYATDIIFHPRIPTHMFCACSDSTVTLWEIGLESSNGKATHRALRVFGSDGGAVLGLAYCCHTDYLVAGCEEGISVWNSSKSTNAKIQKVDKELFLPGKKYPRIECLKSLSSDLVACHEDGDRIIFIWRLSTTLSTSSSRVLITPIAKLQWVTPAVEFINVGGHTGVLGCGDHKGNIWLYNIKSLLKKNTCYPDVLLPPSRVLSWPQCVLNNQREQEQKMTDLLDEPEPLVVNMVCFDADMKHLVAGTDNNLVCVWKQSGS